MIICATIFPYMIVGIATAILGVFSSYVFLPVLAGVLALQSGFYFLLHFDITALVLTILILAGITLVFTYLSSIKAGCIISKAECVVVYCIIFINDIIGIFRNASF